VTSCSVPRTPHAGCRERVQCGLFIERTAQQWIRSLDGMLSPPLPIMHEAAKSGIGRFEPVWRRTDAPWPGTTTHNHNHETLLQSEGLFLPALAGRGSVTSRIPVALR